MHLCFVSRAFAVNPNRREEVTIIFSAVLIVDWGRREAAWIDCGEFMAQAAPCGFSLSSDFRWDNIVCCGRQNSQSQTAAVSLLRPLFWLSFPARNSGTGTSCSVSSLSAEACAVPSWQQGKSQRAVLSFSSSQRPLPPAVQTRAWLPGHYWTSVPCLPMSYGKCEWQLHLKHIRRGNMWLWHCSTNLSLIVFCLKTE